MRTRASATYVDTLARAAHAYVLLGIVAHTAGGAPLNSAALVSPAGFAVSRYDKVNLVPFGEFVPWPFGALATKISTEVGDFAAGTPRGGFAGGRAPDRHVHLLRIRLSQFRAQVRRRRSGGALQHFQRWLVRHSAARLQHLEIVRMRAAENRRWILRSTNDGITATIDAAGRLRGRLPLYVQATSYTGFNYESGKTVYTRFGDWFPLLCATLAIACLIAHKVL